MLLMNLTHSACTLLNLSLSFPQTHTPYHTEAVGISMTASTSYAITANLFQPLLVFSFFSRLTRLFALKTISSLQVPSFFLPNTPLRMMSVEYLWKTSKGTLATAPRIRLATSRQAKPMKSGTEKSLVAEAGSFWSYCRGRQYNLTSPLVLIYWCKKDKYPEDVVHGYGHPESSVVGSLYHNGVRDEVWAKHQTECDESTWLLGFPSYVYTLYKNGQQ